MRSGAPLRRDTRKRLFADPRKPKAKDVRPPGHFRPILDGVHPSEPTAVRYSVQRREACPGRLRLSCDRLARAEGQRIGTKRTGQRPCAVVPVIRASAAVEGPGVVTETLYAERAHSGVEEPRCIRRGPSDEQALGAKPHERAGQSPSSYATSLSGERKRWPVFVRGESWCCAPRCTPAGPGAIACIRWKWIRHSLLTSRIQGALPRPLFAFDVALLCKSGC